MSSPAQYFWRHPRRTGFIIFNLIVIAALVLWGAFSDRLIGGGVSNLPNIMLGYTGMGFLLLAWIVAWVAWGFLVYSRHKRLLEQKAAEPGATDISS